MKIFTLFLVLMVVGCATAPPKVLLPIEKTKTLHHKTWIDRDTTKSHKSPASLDEENFKHNYVHTGYM